MADFSNCESIVMTEGYTQDSWRALLQDIPYAISLTSNECERDLSYKAILALYNSSLYIIFLIIYEYNLGHPSVLKPMKSA